MVLAKSHQLHEKARQCRELAETAMTEEARLVLQEIAHKYEAEAAVINERSRLATA